MAVHIGKLIGYVPNFVANAVGKYQSAIKVTMEFNNGSNVIMDCNDMINVFNARDKYGDPIWVFNDILGHRNQGI